MKKLDFLKQTGYQMNTFIKEAVIEKLQRMGSLDPDGNLVTNTDMKGE